MYLYTIALKISGQGQTSVKASMPNSKIPQPYVFPLPDPDGLHIETSYLSV